MIQITYTPGRVLGQIKQVTPLIQVGQEAGMDTLEKPKNAEQESYFVMDDYNDAEFNYFPDSLNLERRGMGLECAIRGLQWNHILAEDVLSGSMI